MQETKKINPLIALAAISVILFSIVGVGVMTGLISNSFSKGKESTLETAASKSATEESKTVKTESPAPTQKTVAKHSSPNTTQAPSQPAVASQEPVKAASPVCTSCGVVSSVNAIAQQGEGSGLGAVAGGVVGGRLGNQVGGGTGKTIATGVGAVAGGMAGSNAGGRADTKTVWDVSVRCEDGIDRVVRTDVQPFYRPGTRVRLVNGMIQPL